MVEMSRDAEIKGIWTRYAWFYRLLRGAVLIGIGAFVGILIYAEPGVRADYVMNLFVTALSLGATALIFDELNRKRSEDELKQRLVDEAASTSNEIAKNAVHQLRRKGWLEGENGLLKGANLFRANLQGADLFHTNLQGAHLEFVNLQCADLFHAKLEAATLWSANLEEATLWSSNLQGTALRDVNLQAATLWDVNLQQADLVGANLRRANLTGSNLQEADLSNTEFDGSTLLPDGVRWTPETDMRRFTDPTHPDFWQWAQVRRDKSNE